MRSEFTTVTFDPLVCSCRHCKSTVSRCGCIVVVELTTGIFRSVVTKKRRESAHARILEGNLNGELRACVDSRRFFVTTDLKIPVQWFY